MAVPLIAAHRGGAGLWPENSLTAFRHAVRLPIEQIEFDVHRSRDGVLVVHHDATLDRTTTGHGPIADLTWGELQQISVKRTDGERLPRLEEVITLVQPTTISLRLEFKPKADGSRYAGIEAEAVALLRDADMLPRTIFTSFDWDVLETAASLAESQRAIALMRREQSADSTALKASIALAQAKGFRELAPHIANASTEVLSEIRGAGLYAGLFGADTRERIASAFDLQVTAFTTDRPDWAIEERARRT